MLDDVDCVILGELLKDANVPAKKIVSELKQRRIEMTERGVRKRIKRLRDFGIIKGNTIIIDDNQGGKNVARMVLVKFRNTKDLLTRMEDYKKYLKESPFCIFACRIRGDLDWLHLKCFPTKELADMEDDLFRTTFGDIMKEYRSYDAEMVKSNFNSILTAEIVKRYLESQQNRTS